MRSWSRSVSRPAQGADRRARSGRLVAAGSVVAAMALMATAACTPVASAVRSTPSAASPTSTSSAATHLPVPLRVVGVGDSVTAALHCGCRGFVDDYGQLLRADYGIRVTSAEYGVSGATTSSLLPALSGSGTTALALADADVISVTIGANDLYAARARYDKGTCGGPRDLNCFLPAVASMGQGLTQDLAAIDRLTGGRPAQVLVNDYWNVFEDGQVAVDEDGPHYLQDSDTMTRLANAAICSAAAAAGAMCVDTYTPYKGVNGGRDPTDLLASDGDHPNAAGHLVIARAMLAAGLPALLG